MRINKNTLRAAKFAFFSLWWQRLIVTQRSWRNHGTWMCAKAEITHILLLSTPWLTSSVWRTVSALHWRTTTRHIEIIINVGGTTSSPRSSSRWSSSGTLLSFNYLLIIAPSLCSRQSGVERRNQVCEGQEFVVDSFLFMLLPQLLLLIICHHQSLVRCWFTYSLENFFSLSLRPNSKRKSFQFKMICRITNPLNFSN